MKKTLVFICLTGIILSSSFVMGTQRCDKDLFGEGDIEIKVNSFKL